MSRLIDADELLKELESSKLQPTKDTDGFIYGWCEGFNTVVDMIRSQHTAFDTEKVVGQLEEMKSLSEDAVAYEKRHGSIEDRLRAESSFKELNRVIDIVKKGGVE